ncbi:MAG: hypothetical protein ACRCW6_01200, partial [Mycoplasmoidaceae bacterium]
MNKIEKSINQLCPDGVEYRKLGDICSLKTGSQINKNRLSKNNKNNILFPLYNGGVNLSGYHSEFN